ncbi:ABC transporter substrate-binding protein [Tranquillimonas alkanivorans]|uniref:NitT/TauT family transport system substrate-binding protein n=1 Tax=Tranquillimonas alkanivorans TaxID=441119 RepID=A0A1I5WHN2_9RHOB|nr:ABC transporter substrate-binding protein [Tranquillimonas alkanivorans]SFQ18936.1 NitT/TauT family transport system substrate-binding protein [Tranquillimonas alkanivorans]
MTIDRRNLIKGAAFAAAVTAVAPAWAQDDPLRVAMGDIASVESLNLLIAMERAEERGVPMELTYFNSEDVAVQAVLSGEADIGVGAPYAFIQNSDAPIRMFYRMSTLLFFPVVNSEVYSGWEDLDGQEVTVHSRGSGTEALMRLMEKVHDIEYSNISYVPGSEVRAGAMLQGTVNASIVDAANFRLLKEQGGEKFMRLPIEGVNATDEALYANTQVLEERADDIQVFVEELLRTWQDIDEDPSIVGELREQYGLLPDLPDEAASEAVPYYTEAVENGVYPTDGGEPADAKDDIAFLSAAGQVEGDPEQVDASRYWDFGPLEAAKSAN